MRGSPDGYVRADVVDHGPESKSLRVCSPGSDFKMLIRLSMTERYSYGPRGGLHPGHWPARPDGRPAARPGEAAAR
jgi:hypothetical protein